MLKEETRWEGLYGYLRYREWDCSPMVRAIKGVGSCFKEQGLLAGEQPLLGESSGGGIGADAFWVDT